MLAFLSYFAYQGLFHGIVFQQAEVDLLMLEMTDGSMTRTQTNTTLEASIQVPPQGPVGYPGTVISPLVGTELISELTWKS